MTTAKVVFIVHLDSEELELPMALRYAPPMDLRAAVERVIHQWERDGIIYVPDGGETLRYWPAHRIKYIEAGIRED